MNSFRDWAFGDKAPKEPLLRSKKTKSVEPAEAASEEALSARTVKREAVRQTDHRDDDRHRLDEQTVKIVHRRKRHTMTLVNLSGGGAMIEGDAKLKLWDRILVKFGDCG